MSLTSRRALTLPLPLVTLVVFTGTLVLGALVGTSTSDRLATLLRTGLPGGYTTLST